MPTNLTDSFVRNAKFVDKPYEVRDSRIPGLILYVGKLKKTFSWKCELHIVDAEGNKKTRYVKGLIGETVNISVDQARLKAQIAINQAKQDHANNTTATKIFTLKEVLENYLDDLDHRGRSKISRTQKIPEIYRQLPNWLTRDVSTIQRSEVIAAHRRITKSGAPVSANRIMAILRAAFNTHIRSLPVGSVFSNPVDTLAFNVENPNRRVINDFAEWYGKLQHVRNPIRFNCHLFGLLSGLRPKNRIGIRNEWIDLDADHIHFPAEEMKNSLPFSLCLSRRMKSLILDTREINKHTYGTETDWLFPALNRKGEVSPIAEYKQQKLGLFTGHELRRSYRSVAQLIGVPSDDAEMLIAHKLPAIKEAYINRHFVVPRLRVCQERITEAVASLLLGATVEIKDDQGVSFSRIALDDEKLHRDVYSLFSDSN